MTAQLTRARPLLFGSPGRELFGLQHLPGNSSKPRAAVLLCAPFGQEAIRSHRTFKVLGERLARSGHPSLRFDYFGTGDSDGEDSDVTLQGLVADIQSADRQLREINSATSEQRPVIWIGLGLGATAAWIAAAQAARQPDALVVWDPVLDGAEYLSILRTRHSTYLEAAFSLRPRNVTSTGVEEAIGFALSPELLAELTTLSAGTMPLLTDRTRAILFTSRDIPQSAALLARCQAVGRPLRHVELRHDIDWLVESIDNGALVPAPAIQSLVAMAGEGS